MSLITPNDGYKITSLGINRVQIDRDYLFFKTFCRLTGSLVVIKST